MRVIGAGVVVFLTVTAILLYQTSSSEPETMARAVVSPEPTLAMTPTSSPPPPRPTQAPPTATMTVPLPRATVTSAPVEPTVEPIETPLVADPPVIDEPDIAVSEPQATEGTAPDVEQTSVNTEDAAVSLAGLGGNDAWSGAIETPNGGLIGTILSGVANVRAQPSVESDAVGELYAGWPVGIYGVVAGASGADGDLWYQVSGGGYVSAALIGPFVPATPETTYSGNWVDIDLSNNVAVAYVDDVPVNAVTIISGKAGFETPVGEYAIFSRRETDTLDSATVGILPGDPEYYYLPNVPNVQYFADGGFAIHGNYWSDPWQFGTASSHGCVNMLAEDAAWFWSFLDIGSVVNVHD